MLFTFRRDVHTIAPALTIGLCGLSVEISVCYIITCLQMQRTEYTFIHSKVTVSAQSPHNTFNVRSKYAQRSCNFELGSEEMSRTTNQMDNE